MNNFISNKQINLLNENYSSVPVNNESDGNSSNLESAVKEVLGGKEQSAKISLDKYEEEWASVITEFSIDKLKSRCHDGGLRASRFRSIYWRLFLKILGRDPGKWAGEVEDHRHLYSRLQEELESSPWSASNASPEDNPLSQDGESMWCRYFCDEELRSMIKQDVIRTFPGIDFFRSSDIQNAMIKILFLYARKNPILCYRQGMHEILAPILFVLHCDQEAFAHAQDMGPCDRNLAVMLDPLHLASDGFTIFSRVMANLEFSYAVPTKSLSSSVLTETGGDRDNEVVWRLDYIRDKLLARADPEMAEHLRTLDIPLQLFGIRWLRLLFGREFPLQDLLMLWDVIFTTDDFYIVDYIVVAMIIAIRHLLIGRDYTACLSHVMRYPSGVDVSHILQHAHYLLDPQRFPPPPRPPTCPPAAERSTRRYRLSSMRALSLPSPSGRYMNLSQATAAHDPTAHRTASGSFSGCSFEEQERLRVEIEHLRAVMSLVRIKISQYHEALLPAVIASTDPEAFQALDGLHELCTLMKDVPVSEVADIAVEACPSPVQRPELINTQPISQPRPHIPELEVFKHTFGGASIDGAPMIDPLHRAHLPAPRAEDCPHFYKEFNQLGIKH